MIGVAPVLPGETLADGKYRVERVLGQGGMGIVVAARHVELDERVAIKFLVGEPDPDAVERFLREARAAVKVKGEHVCRVLDFGRLQSGEPYIVMEHLDGTDLAKLVKQRGPQDSTAAVGWVIEACDALAAAHSLGIVHRDIKPANIFLASRVDGTTVAKVLDFGISKLPCNGTQMTGAQTAMGSPAYMSPEQMESARDVDGRTDIWSLGVTLYELLAGRPPFVSDSMVQLAVLVREREAPSLDGVPEALAAVVRRCLAKDPRERYQTVASLVAELAPFAPEEATGLVRRLSRRDSSPDRAAALAATALEIRPIGERGGDRRSAEANDLDVERAALAESRDDGSNDRAVGKGTFAPLQSTLDRTGTALVPKRRPWLTHTVVAAVVLAGLAGAGALLARAPAPASSALPESGPPRDQPPARPTLAEASSAAPSASSSAHGAPAATPTPSTAISTKPRVNTATAVPRDAAAPVRTDPSSTSSAPSLTSATSATTEKPEPKKRRDLDRDDP